MSDQRDVLEVDVLFVGGGPAGLAGALRMTQLLEENKRAAQDQRLGEISIAVLEKSSEIGAHGISGCVLDPRALQELIPDFKEKGAPIESEVTSDDLFYFTGSGQIRFPLLPPPLRNHGNYVVSLGNLEKWMGGLLESTGAYVLPSMAAVEGLFEGERMVGVRTGDKGIDRHGNRKPNFEPGADVRAKITVLCEGVRGSLTKRLTPQLKLEEGRAPQIYATGIKEVWRMPQGRVPKGRVIHTMGHPLDSKTSGGGFIYGMDQDRCSVGFVVGLDYWNPTTDPRPDAGVQAASLRREAARGRNAPFLRRESHTRGRLLLGAPALLAGRAPLRRQRRAPELGAAQGSPPRDEIGNARRRDGVRRPAKGGFRRGSDGRL